MFKNTDEAAGYLAGMIDGEGTVTSGTDYRRQVRISNTDLALLEACQAACAMLGIGPTRIGSGGRQREAHHAAQYQLAIGGRANLEALATLPLQSPKRDRLRATIASYKSQRAYGLAPPDDLATRYRSGETAVALAAAHGVSHTTILRWLERAGVPRREKGRPREQRGPKSGGR